MKRYPIYAGLIAGIWLASCSGNTTPPLTPNAGIAPPNAASVGLTSAEKAPQGWAATATQAVSAKIFGRSPTVASVPATMPLRIVVGLYLRDPAELKALVRSQYTPGHLDFHNWLTLAQFTSRFSPTRSTVSSVADYLRQQGLTDVTITPNNLMVTATGSVSHVEAAFHTSIRGTIANGKLVYGNVTPAIVPEKFHGIVAGVLGLHNAYQMHTHLLKSTHPNRANAAGGVGQPMVAGTPPPCLEVVNGICVFGEYGPPQYQVAYDAVGSTASTGKKTAIAVMAEGNVSGVVSDLRAAEAFWGLPTVRYSVVKVPPASTDTSGLDEWDLDTQISSGIAQTVNHLYVYDTTSLGDADIAREYTKWVTEDNTQAGNSSFGEPEVLAFADGAMTIDDETLAEAAAQGMTMFASTGDNGSGCPVIAATGAPNSGVPNVCYPASSPYVVAVGGTTLDSNANGMEPGTYYGEHVWVGTGGGYSAFESAPYWQTNGICAVCGPDAIRGIADISMCADNNGCPMDVFVSGKQEGVGGTSLSSPMSMGIWSRLETHFRNKLGFAAPVYYGVYGFYEPCALGNTACTPAGEPGDFTSALPPEPRPRSAASTTSCSGPMEFQAPQHRDGTRRPVSARSTTWSCSPTFRTRSSRVSKPAA